METAASRTVRLNGAMNFDVQDFSGVTGVRQDPDDERYFLVDFRRAEDAARYRAKFAKKQGGEPVAAKAAAKTAAATVKPVQSSLEPPPGLEQTPLRHQRQDPTSDAISSGEHPQHVTLRPGLDEGGNFAGSSCSTATSTPPCPGDKMLPVIQVTIDGLPNDILASPMFEAVLQQAGLSDWVRTYKTKKGKPCGTAHVAIVDPVAAAWCVEHFNGCQWHTSGTIVTAYVDFVTDESATQATLSEGYELAQAPKKSDVGGKVSREYASAATATRTKRSNGDDPKWLAKDSGASAAASTAASTAARSVGTKAKAVTVAPRGSRRKPLVAYPQPEMI